MSVITSDRNSDEQETITATPATSRAPKRITNAQTVCNERNEKGKLCNGHLKQLRTAGEASEVHLRGDDVLFKCQTCGTVYMGPPLGHVRDPHKQRRFVEAELTALLQAAGGTLPVIKKDARGVFVMAEAGAGHAAVTAKPTPPRAIPTKAAPPPVAPAATVPPATPPTATAKPAAAPPAAPAAGTHKAGAQPNRELMKRSTYAGVVDSGPVPGETFEQKVARLKAVSAAAKRRAEEGGAEAVNQEPAAAAPVAEPQTSPPPSEPALPAPVTAALAQVSSAPAPAAHKPTGEADRTLMRRSTYCGVVDTGPVPGESFAQKVERLRAVAAAAKQRSEAAGS